MVGTRFTIGAGSQHPQAKPHHQLAEARDLTQQTVVTNEAEGQVSGALSGGLLQAPHRGLRFTQAGTDQRRVIRRDIPALGELIQLGDDIPGIVAAPQGKPREVRLSTESAEAVRPVDGAQALLARAEWPGQGAR